MAMAEMTEPTAVPDTALRLLGLRTVLLIMAVLEASTLLGDMPEVPGPGFGGFLVKAHIATYAVLALAALLLAVIGPVRYTIIALAAAIVMTWLNYLPSVIRDGLDFSGIGVFETPARIIIFPLMAACAIACAARNQRLGIATALVSIPILFQLFDGTLFQWFGLIALLIHVSIHGF